NPIGRNTARLIFDAANKQANPDAWFRTALSECRMKQPPLCPPSLEPGKPLELPFDETSDELADVLSASFELWGTPLGSCFGVSASPYTGSFSGVKRMADWHCDIITYKTVRTRERPREPLRCNLAYVLG